MFRWLEVGKDISFDIYELVPKTWTINFDKREILAFDSIYFKLTIKNKCKVWFAKFTENGF